MKTIMRRAAMMSALLSLGVIGIQARDFVINRDSTHQTIDCFGASDAWSFQSVGLMDEPVRKSVADWLFSKKVNPDGSPCGIGLSMWRFNIGAGSAEQSDESRINKGTRTECTVNADGVFDPSKQKGQRQFLKLAKEYGVENLLGFLNSPPVYLTKNGLATNTGRNGTFNLKDDAYADFAKFMADVIEGLERADGIKLNYIAPVNEPDGHWNWQGPKQEGTPATNREIAKITRLLDNELVKRNISTEIIIPESSDYRCLMGEHMAGRERGYEIQSFFGKDSTATYVGNLKRVPNLIVGHSYWTNTPVDAMKRYREQLRDTLHKYGVDFWQTEVCIMGNDEEIGGGGGYDRTMKTALYVARVIHHDLVFANARSWQWWRAVGGNYKDGLLFMYNDKATGNDTIVDSKLLWALGNYSRFVRPGAVRLDVTGSDGNGQHSADGATDPYGLMCSAYENSDGSIVSVIINYSDEMQDANVALVSKDGKQPYKEWNVYRTSDSENESLGFVETRRKLGKMSMPPKSITTIVSGKAIKK